MKVGEQFLYHWKTFPIILPPPADAIQPAHGSLSSNGEIPYITGIQLCLKCTFSVIEIAERCGKKVG